VTPVADDTIHNSRSSSSQARPDLRFVDFSFPGAGVIYREWFTGWAILGKAGNDESIY